MTDPIRVLIVDDHPIVRGAIRRLLCEQPDIECVGEAAVGEEAVDKALDLRPGVVLMDVSLPGKSGIEATREIVSRWPEAKVVVLSSYSEADAGRAARVAGAVGYVEKGAPPGELIAAIRAAG